MTVSLMRHIDRIVGIPLCFLMSIVHGIRRFVASLNPKECQVKKILVIKLSELGAIILAYPLFEQLKTSYPDATIHVLTFEKNKKIFCFLNNIVEEGNIITVSDVNAGVMTRDFFAAIRRLMAQEYDVVIDLEFFSRVSALLSFVSNAPKVVGFYPYGFEGLYRGNFLTHRVAYNSLAHISVNYYSLGVALREDKKMSPEVSVAINERSFKFPLLQQSTLDLAHLNLPSDKKIFLMNAGEGVLPLREWPFEHFVTVAKFILSKENNVLVLVGTESAHAKADQLAKVLNSSRVFNFSGKTSLDELMAIFIKAQFIIANDCGLMHLAMLTPIQKFVFFGPETPQVFGPLGEKTHVFYSQWPCSPCLSVLTHRHSSCRNNMCLKIIEPNQVINTIRTYV